MTNTEIQTTKIIDLIKIYQYDNLNNVKLCIIEMNKRGKTLNDSYITKISKHFSLINKSLLYVVDDENLLIDTNSAFVKKSYFLKFKISLIFLIFIAFIIHLSFTSNIIQIQSEIRRVLIGGFIVYKGSLYYLNKYYSQIYQKINFYVFAFFIILGFEVVAAIIQFFISIILISNLK